MRADGQELMAKDVMQIQVFSRREDVYVRQLLTPGLAKALQPLGRQFIPALYLSGKALM